MNDVDKTACQECKGLMNVGDDAIHLYQDDFDSAIHNIF